VRWVLSIKSAPWPKECRPTSLSSRSTGIITPMTKSTRAGLRHQADDVLLSETTVMSACIPSARAPI